MSKEDSTIALLKLYELRRDEQMRAARQWFFSQFAPKTTMDIVALYRGGERASANFRMVASYWDMAASFALNGGIDEKMFLDASSEYIFVYAKIQPFLAELRELFGEPDLFQHLENLCLRIPNIEAKLENRRRLIGVWTKDDEKAESA